MREETLQQQAELAGGKGDKKDKIIRTILKSERERRDHATLKRSMKSVRAGADPEVEVPKTATSVEEMWEILKIRRENPEMWMKITGRENVEAVII